MYCDVNLPLWITYNFTYVVSLFFIFFIVDKN